MSIVNTRISSEARLALGRQRRIASALSVVIAVLVVALIGSILAFIIFPALRIHTPVIIAYRPPLPAEEEIDRPEVNTQVQRQPSAPSSAMAKVIASTTPSPTSVPVPEEPSLDPSLDFGDGDDFGAGWGGGDGIGGGATFFGQTVRAERLAYVIDYSLSMKQKGGEKLGREGLMRKELAKSIDQLFPGTNYAMIFFAGPAWVAGDEVAMDKGKNRREATVKGKRGHSFDWKSDGTAHDWKPAGEREEVEWITASKGTIAKSKKVIEETKLVWGTNWENPLEMALAMDPPPQVIYFMTDGAAKGSDRWVREIGARAKSLGVTINCIAMMQPQAHDDMEDLAKRTGGQFTIVMKDGTHQKVR